MSTSKRPTFSVAYVCDGVEYARGTIGGYTVSTHMAMIDVLQEEINTRKEKIRMRRVQLRRYAKAKALGFAHK